MIIHKKGKIFLKKSELTQRSDGSVQTKSNSRYRSQCVRLYTSDQPTGLVDTDFFIVIIIIIIYFAPQHEAIKVWRKKDKNYTNKTCQASYSTCGRI